MGSRKERANRTKEDKIVIYRDRQRPGKSKRDTRERERAEEREYN